MKATATIPKRPQATVTVTLGEKEARILLVFMGSFTSSDWKDVITEEFDDNSEIFPSDFIYREDVKKDLCYEFYKTVSSALEPLGAH